MNLGSFHHRCAPSESRKQSGYILIMILLAVALMVIALTAAAPRMVQEIKREREIEMMHRGDQYARAIKRYYKKFNRYPLSIEQLENTNQIRFLRKKYKDPMNPEGVWKVVHAGEVQLGQQQALLGAKPLTPSTFGSNTGGGTVGGGTGGNPGTSGNPGTGGAAGTGGIFGSTNQTFGGGPIIGVASLSEAKGIHEFDNKSHYNQWYFIYDPNQDRNNLLKGPYNPKAFVGQSNIPGAVSPQNMNNQGNQQQQKPIVPVGTPVQ